MYIREVLRYLGYGMNVPDDRVMNIIEECISEVKAAAEPKNVCRRFNIRISGDDIYAEDTYFKSHALAVNLKGCKEAFFMAVTLGIGVDRLLNRNLRLDMTRAAIIQAVAAAEIEEYCDACQLNIEKEVSAAGLHVRPRFSPGFGDFGLEVQQIFLDITGGGKKLGISLTDGGIMIPEKSVTAVIGLTDDIKEARYGNIG